MPVPDRGAFAPHNNCIAFPTTATNKNASSLEGFNAANIQRHGQQKVSGRRARDNQNSVSIVNAILLVLGPGLKQCRPSASFLRSVNIILL
jgi:hypothetical protein